MFINMEFFRGKAQGDTNEIGQIVYGQTKLLTVSLFDSPLFHVKVDVAHRTGNDHTVCAVPHRIVENFMRQLRDDGIVG